MLPMIPMPCAVRPLRCGLRYRISGGSPLASRRLSGQYKATRTCAVHLHQARCDELASPSLGIDQYPDRLRQLCGCHRLFLVMLPPRRKQLRGASTTRIIGLRLADALHRVLAS